MLLGIVLHASIAYLTVSPHGLLWPVRDPLQSYVCDVLAIWIHAFRLPVFFVLAGYFAELLASQRGADAFMKHRVERLLWPYLLSLITIGPLTLAVSIWGWHVSGICSWNQLIDPALPLPEELTAAGFGPGHLWFLQDLLLMSVGFWLLRRNFEPTESPVQAETEARLLQRSWWHPWICALPTGLLLWSNQDPVISFNNTFLPVPSRLMYYGLFFAWGILFYRWREPFTRAVLHPRNRLWGGVALSVPMIPLTLALEQSVAPASSSDLFHGSMAPMAFCTALVAWLSIFGWFGVFLRDWSKHERVVRYLSDSAYWIYLIHLPIVVVLQILLRPVSLPPTVKVLLITLVTFFVALSMYAGFVRHTWIGRMLHGPRRA